MLEKMYKAIIVGIGVSGAASLYMLTRYTNVVPIAVIEKYDGPAKVNSDPKNNAQTLHRGATETNYSLEKALLQKEAGDMVARYIESKGPAGGLFRRLHIMALAVGRAKVARLRERYEVFKNYYPKLRFLDREGIAKIEPIVVDGRRANEEIAALVSEDGIAVNYQKLAECLLQDALDSKKDIGVFFKTEVKRVSREAGHYSVETSWGNLRGESIIFTSGPYSLVFAQTLGYCTDLEILSVAGSFYFSRKVPNGKIYPMQREGMPFAEHHLDPDVTDPSRARFGPTAKIVPEMERRKPKTFFDYVLRTPVHTPRGVCAIVRAVLAKVPLDFVIKNAIYDMPVVGKWLFLKSARKTVPLLRYSDLTLGKELGGVRPQIVNMKTKRLEMGEARIVGDKNGDKIIANTTPSPGASSSMKNGERDARQIVEFLGEGFWFDEEKFRKDFG